MVSSPDEQPYERDGRDFEHKREDLAYDEFDAARSGSVGPPDSINEYQDRASATQGGSPLPVRISPTLLKGKAVIAHPAYSGKPTLLDHRTAVNAGGTNSWRTVSPTPARKAAVWRSTSFTTAFRSGIHDASARMGAQPQPQLPAKAGHGEATRGRSPSRTNGRAAWHNTSPTTIFTSGTMDASCSLGCSPPPPHMRASPTHDSARPHSRPASPTRTWRPAAATTAFIGGICNKSLNMQTPLDYVPVNKAELAKLEGSMRSMSMTGSRAGRTRGGSPTAFERTSSPIDSQLGPLPSTYQPETSQEL